MDIFSPSLPCIHPATNKQINKSALYDVFWYTSHTCSSVFLICLESKAKKETGTFSPGSSAVNNLSLNPRLIITKIICVLVETINETEKNNQLKVYLGFFWDLKPKKHKMNLVLVHL